MIISVECGAVECGANFQVVTKRFRDIYVEVRHVRYRRSTVATRLRIAVSLWKFIHLLHKVGVRTTLNGMALALISE